MIPLGILAVAGASGAAAGAYELISTAYGTGSSTSVTFSSIPSTYKHLQLRVVGQHDGFGSANIWLRFNGDTSSTRPNHTLQGTGSSVLATANTATTYGNQVGFFARNGINANAYSAAIIDVLDYSSTSKNKTVKSLTGVDVSPTRVGVWSSLWIDTSAISSITVISNDGNLTTASRFSLYGIKG